MPFDGTLRPRASTEEVSRAYENLVRLEQFFDGGRKWHRGDLRDGRGSFCLIGAVDRLRCDDLTLRYLVRVARTRHERCPFGHPVIAEMNDRCGDFGNSATVLVRLGHWRPQTCGNRRFRLRDAPPPPTRRRTGNTSRVAACNPTGHV
jgi:hypothetical protein